MKQILLWAILSTWLLVGPVRARAVESDFRVLQMEAVLKAYNSPMLPHAKELIAIAEEHNLDWTLMAAIAGTESAFGRRMPSECINPYGWGIYGGRRLCFESFPDAARAVARGLATRYNTTSLETIGATYNKVSTEGWITHTRFFANKIKAATIPVSSLPITL